MIGDHEIKIDLHTHSILSHDGGITESQYLDLVERSVINFIAITDHNEIEFALQMRKKYGERFIVGEEIKTDKGEIIGLFLTRKIEKDLSVEETISQIKEQSGLVYIPHPFDRRRSAIDLHALEENLEKVDIFETYNQRTFRDVHNKEAEAFARSNNLITASGSDSHSPGEVGRTYMSVLEKPTVENLVKLIENAQCINGKMHFNNIFAPKYNKLKKIFV